MTLEGAKKILNKRIRENTIIANYWKDKYNDCTYGNPYIKENKAIDTVLKALEDSIPKEKVREKIEQLTENDNLVVNEKWDSVDVVCAKREEMAQVDILKELLGDESHE